jgi:hypothetical protein
LALGGVVSLVLLSGAHNFFMDVGSPLELVLRQSLILDENRLAAALAQAPAEVQPIIPVPRRILTQAAGKPPWDCPVGQEWCSGSCRSTISFTTDSSNCGRCGNQCSFSQTCSGGSCVCGPGHSSCMGSCVSDASFLGDTSNCGRCGNSCSIGESCLGGSCTKIMP